VSVFFFSLLAWRQGERTRRKVNKQEHCFIRLRFSSTAAHFPAELAHRHLRLCKRKKKNNLQGPSFISVFPFFFFFLLRLGLFLIFFFSACARAACHCVYDNRSVTPYTLARSHTHIHRHTIANTKILFSTRLFFFPSFSFYLPASLFSFLKKKNL
jgi:hypothetical protein